MGYLTYTRLKISESKYYLGLLFLFTLVSVGLISAYYMETRGHWITGMNNQVIWGIPHVFAITLIVASSGALNIASLGSLFGRPEYKPFGRLSGLLAIGLLVGGLSILVLDLGRPDRLIVAMTHYNFTSIFAWNIFLYSGFLLIVAFYIWSMMERGKGKFTKAIASFAFFWRIALTTGTGLIFGFLIAREAYDSALMAPLFIAISLVLGLAIFCIIIALIELCGKNTFQECIWEKAKSLFLFFISANIYLTLVLHLTGLYAAEHSKFEGFILLDGGIITALFWLGQVTLGSLVPVVLLFTLIKINLKRRIIVSSILAAFGCFIQVYVIIIGGQSQPLVLFPSVEVSSSFFDGSIDTYIPSFWEFGLGIGGSGFALTIIYIGLNLLNFIPIDYKEE